MAYPLEIERGALGLRSTLLRGLATSLSGASAYLQLLEMPAPHRLRNLPRMAEIVCTECGYRVNVVRTGPGSAMPEHDHGELQRLCRDGPFRYHTGTGCSNLDQAYLAARRRGEF